MRSPKPGTARALVYAVLHRLGPDQSAAAIVRAAGDAFSRANLDQAIQRGVAEGDIERTGEHRNYRYELRAEAAASLVGASGAVPPPCREERGSCSRRRRSIARSRHEVRRAA